MASFQMSGPARWLGLLGMFVATIAHAEEANAGRASIGIVRALPVSLAQADAAREGAGELVVLMEIARVQGQREKGGLVGVGNRRGLFSCDAEEALRRAVLAGIPVVKLAPQGEVLPAPHGLFLDGGNLSEADACRVLAQCLRKYGALPRAKSAEPDTRELAAIQSYLKPFQQQLTLATRARLAAR